MLFGQAVFFKLLLVPPIIYESSFNMYKSKALLDKYGINVFATSLTLFIQVTTLTIGFYYGLRLFESFLECLLLSVLLSTVDGFIAP